MTTDENAMDKTVQLRTKVAHVPEWANYIAQDESGGWYAFYEQPLLRSFCWLPKWNPYRRGIGISRRFALEQPNPNWRESCRPI